MLLEWNLTATQRVELSTLTRIRSHLFSFPKALRGSVSASLHWLAYFRLDFYISWWERGLVHRFFNCGVLLQNRLALLLLRLFHHRSYALVYFVVIE